MKRKRKGKEGISEAFLYLEIGEEGRPGAVDEARKFMEEFGFKAEKDGDKHGSQSSPAVKEARRSSSLRRTGSGRSVNEAPGAPPPAAYLIMLHMVLPLISAVLAVFLYIPIIIALLLGPVTFILFSTLLNKDNEHASDPQPAFSKVSFYLTLLLGGTLSLVAILSGSTTAFIKISIITALVGGYFHDRHVKESTGGV